MRKEANGDSEMHSGSFISPKHPAIPVSIGIASIVLEGRPAILEDGASRNSSNSGGGTGGSGSGASGDGSSTSGGGRGSGPSAGSGNGGGASSDEDGGFPSSEFLDSTATSAAAAAAASTPLGAFKSFQADAAQRINLKLQQICSFPGSSKEQLVEQMVTVAAGSSGSGSSRTAVGGGRLGSDEDGTEYDGYGVESFPSCETAGTSETSPLIFRAKAWTRGHIHSGFEQMKLLGTVSPIKTSTSKPFINFSGSTSAASTTAVSTTNVNVRKKSDAGIGSPSGTSSTTAKQRPREGPHCEQFLKKVGLIKMDANEELEHSCSYRNELCLHWQTYFKQLSSILTSGEAICIEVYLGPENHAILLEQWILKLKLKSSESTMTLQSLCAAIRSQLYFSQISAWTDLIKNSLEPDIFQNPRIKKCPSTIPPTSAASTAATTAGNAGNKTMGSPFRSGESCGGETSPPVLPIAKLDILFRIRGYDNTACFNEKPNVHNFPDAIIADNYAIQVCLKSLPRMERIPNISISYGNNNNSIGNRENCNNISNESMSMKMMDGGDRGGAAVGLVVRDSLDLPCHEHGKHRCAAFQQQDADPEEDDSPSSIQGEDDDIGGPSRVTTVSHREKQLMKYKKRMQRRERKKKANGGSGEAQQQSRAATSAAGSDLFDNSNASDHFSCNSNSSIGSNCSVQPYTSSINPIHPPLYSTCDDLFQPSTAVANSNTKATQTAFFLGMMSSSGGCETVTTATTVAATQTDVTGCCCQCAKRWRTSDEDEDTIMMAFPLSAMSTSKTNNNKHSDRQMQYSNSLNGSCSSCTNIRRDCTTNSSSGDVCDKMMCDETRKSGTAVVSFVVGDPQDQDDIEAVNKSTSGHLEKADLLLQAIERTAIINDQQQQKHARMAPFGINDYYNSGNGDKPRSCVNDNNNIRGSGDTVAEATTTAAAVARCVRIECDNFTTLDNKQGGAVAREATPSLDIGDCRLCKRQKTKHNFKLALKSNCSDSSTASVFLPPPPATSCRRTLSESLVGHLTIPSTTSRRADAKTASNSVNAPSSDFRNGHSDNDGEDDDDDLNLIAAVSTPLLSSSAGTIGHRSATAASVTTPGASFTFEQLKSYRRAFSEDVIDTIDDDDDDDDDSVVHLEGSTGGIHGKSLSRCHGSSLEQRRRSSDGGCDDDDYEDDDDDDDAFHRCECAHTSSTESVTRKFFLRPSQFSTPNLTRPLSAASSNGQEAAAAVCTPNSHNSGNSGAAGGGCNLRVNCNLVAGEGACSVSTASMVSPHKRQILSCSSTTMAGASMPKINLNNVFNESASSPSSLLMAREDSGFGSVTSPIPIERSTTAGGACSGSNSSSSFSFSEEFSSSATNGFSGNHHKAPNNLPSLSPRFMRQAFKQHQRSRYASDRSSLSEEPPSSIGSDDGGQLSDDEMLLPPPPAAAAPQTTASATPSYTVAQLMPLPLLVPSASTSSSSSRSSFTTTATTILRSGTATKAVLAGLLPTSRQAGGPALPSFAKGAPFRGSAFRFGALPMLGTLEESLLQRRLSPKFQVADFKVLLGASGSFCPTQLTIPAASYFYELHGQHLTTPYVSEIRLPRKGYSIPRQGTVQVTLLNPLGTVVRMFVVPYDFRDMPVMSTTFIRQRILAYDEQQKSTPSTVDSSSPAVLTSLFSFPSSSPYTSSVSSSSPPSSSSSKGVPPVEQLSNGEQMKLLRYAIHLRFQTSRSGKLSLHTDIRLLISRRTDCDTAAAHAKNLLEAPNELKVVTIVPDHPKYSQRMDK